MFAASAAAGDAGEGLISDGRERCCCCFPRLLTEESEGRWWGKGRAAVMKAREWSEMAAGPRWKTFLRRFRRVKSRGGGAHGARFQYDPLSYALNFDDGHALNGALSDPPDHAFSARFAKPPPDLARDPPESFPPAGR